MNLRPVIERELRTSARQVTTYYSRLVPGVLMLSFAGLMYGTAPGSISPAELGSVIFSILNATLFSLIWIIVPLSSADVISREKREDTLGLLLLTPLRPHEIVISKLVSGVFQGFGLILAGLPILAIPMLLGGVTPMDLIRIGFLNLSALVGAAAAGVVTSSFSEKRGRAWFVSVIVAALSFTVLYSIHVLLLHVGRGGAGARQYFVDPFDTFWSLAAYGWLVSSGVVQFWRDAGYPSNSFTVGISAAVFVLSILFSSLGILYAARRVRRFADERNLSVRQEKIRSTFTRERFFAETLKKGRRRLLERNPAAWMVQRKWSARLSKWGWMFLSIFVVTLVLVESGLYFAETVDGCIWMGIFMLLTSLLISATNLQHERDSGALELLLVTHLSPKRFIEGRLRGIRNSFVPGALSLVAMFGFAGLSIVQLRLSYNSGWQMFALATYGSIIVFFLLLLYFLPVIGLCFSINRPGILSSCLNTFFFGIVVPWMLPVAAFGTGVFIYGGIHENFADDFFYKTILFGAIAVLVTFQLLLWFAIKRGKLAGFPKLWPNWFSRRRSGWFVPWLVPLIAWLCVEINASVFGGGLFSGNTLFFTWQFTAWALLLYVAMKCKRALIETLEKRTFLSE